MKKILFVIVLLYPAFLFGQLNDKFELGISLNTVEPHFPLANINFLDNFIDGGDCHNKSFALGITGKYSFKEPLAFHLRFIWTNRNVHDRRELENSLDDVKFRQSLLKFSPGILWTFSHNRISFFSGVELPVTIIGKMKEYYYSQYGGDIHDGIQKIQGGYSIGLGIFLGSNYFFLEHFGLGLDINTAFQYASVGGTIISQGTVTNNSIVTEESEEWHESIKQFSFLPIQASINIITRF